MGYGNVILNYGLHPLRTSRFTGAIHRRTVTDFPNQATDDRTAGAGVRRP